MGIRTIFMAGVLLLSLPMAAFAVDGASTGYQADLEDLKKRVDELEKRTEGTERVDERSHRLHPIHSIYGLKIAGGVTMTGQGVYGLKPGQHQAGAAALSADISIVSPVGADGLAVGVLDFQRGTGLTNIPPFFKSPNGNTTGANADIESFDNDQLHATEFYYEHKTGDALALTLGQLSLTGYIDANAYANDERAQFLANSFVNNPTIEFGGSDNFYGLGARVTYTPFKGVDLTAGAFDGDGDYAETFDRPFVMAELDVNTGLFGREGNYRLYYWNRQGRPAASLGDTANPNDPALEKAANQGAGISFDQELTEDSGVWLRAGMQRHKVAQSDRYVGAGGNLKGVAGRAEDTIGFGYGVSFMGKDYKGYLADTQPSFRASAEHYLEIYYNVAVDGATDDTGFHIAPDIQYVVNPGGDADAAKFFIYGMRLQTFF